MTSPAPERVYRDTNPEIRISRDVWVALNKLKEPRDTFDDVLRRLLADAKPDQSTDLP